MKNSSLALAFKIAALLEEYSENELRVALELLSKHGKGAPLLRQLIEDHGDPPQRQSRPSSSRNKDYDITSKAVMKLKVDEPDKFRILSEFDALVRHGKILEKSEELRRFGERLTKDFSQKKSRSETINAVMDALARKPMAEIEQEISYAASLEISGHADDYQKLAKFLITGGIPR